ncbi:hypothetical protein NDS46_22500 [Paenibacillus thiaminolyticus]|uniref:hypothetical protein n=1 Tax=Paenibacillus thiaminolyticus TaxID=49283 RepID=UPI00232F8976|nr:hypothetical protein [Paenibacillus thiaminolyticus]WCF07080.1 hypothetical protein NDS46_22500 [Paenibacillus thiaminolyticus]
MNSPPFPGRRQAFPSTVSFDKREKALPSANVLPLLHLALRAAFFFHADVDHRIDGCPLALGQVEQLMRQNAKLVEGVIGIVRFAVALPN